MNTFSNELYHRQTFFLRFCNLAEVSKKKFYFGYLDTDEIVPQDTGHYDYGAPTPKAQIHHPLNTLNTINSVLLRKTSINKLSR